MLVFSISVAAFCTFCISPWLSPHVYFTVSPSFFAAAGSFSDDGDGIIEQHEYAEPGPPDEGDKQ